MRINPTYSGFGMSFPAVVVCVNLRRQMVAYDSGVGTKSDSPALPLAPACGLQRTPAPVRRACELQQLFQFKI